MVEMKVEHWAVDSACCWAEQKADWWDYRLVAQWVDEWAYLRAAHWEHSKVQHWANLKAGRWAEKRDNRKVDQTAEHSADSKEWSLEFHLAGPRAEWMAERKVYQRVAPTAVLRAAQWAAVKDSHWADCLVAPLAEN